MGCADMKKPTTKTCERCGFTTDNPLVMLCPRCATKLPGHPGCMGCGGHCASTPSLTDNAGGK